MNPRTIYLIFLNGHKLIKLKLFQFAYCWISTLQASKCLYFFLLKQVVRQIVIKFGIFGQKYKVMIASLIQTILILT